MGPRHGTLGTPALVVYVTYFNPARERVFAHRRLGVRIRVPFEADASDYIRLRMTSQGVGVGLSQRRTGPAQHADRPREALSWWVP